MSQIITPYLLYEDAAAAVDFLTSAFGFREVNRTVGVAGGMHVELELPPHGALLYLGSPGGDFRNPAVVGRTSSLYVLVDDVDAHYERARAAGVRITEEPFDLPFGHRRYSCRDPQGHDWSFAQVEEPLTR
jgi:uncharacterized glyoxalase superfamily protein PhnB